MDDETQAAWERLNRGLNEISAAPEMLHFRARGVRQFAMTLRDICEDIGAHMVADSFDHAMQKLRAGFLRAQRQEQDQARSNAEAWVIEEWKAHAGQYMNNKSRFARRYETRLKDERGMDVTQRTIKERWLK